jgi:quinoprotein glucose dehydrogenase
MLHLIKVKIGELKMKVNYCEQAAKFVVAFYVMLFCYLPFSVAQVRSENVSQEWRFYGGDAGGSRYSPLNQINRRNVHRLKRAWTYSTGELELGLREADFKASFTSTPLYVNGTLYISTPSSRVIALDGETGKELWQHDPQRGKRKREFNSHRGVAYWEGKASNGRTILKRIFSGTVDGRLIALDAVTGKLSADFGNGGAINLRAGISYAGANQPSWGARITSPPAVYRNLIITGWGLPESPATGASGDVRAFDARTGKLVWTFHTVPRPGEPGHETWVGDSWRNRSGANVWATMSVDEKRGLIFLPIGSPTYDFYGGDRKGDNLFGNSIVALDAASGKIRWFFQTTHHDLWDYDVPAQPNLVTLRRNGRDIAAVAQITKTGFVFVFDRETGKPLFPIEERPFPQSRVPGEETSPTQPIPLKPAPFTRQTMTRSEISKVTPQSERYCTELYDQLSTQGLYTPAGIEPTLMFPGFHGGGNWSGASFDSTSGVLYVNANEDGAIGAMTPQAPGADAPFMRHGRFEEYAWFRDQKGYPCQQPPWGTLSAIDLNKGEILWRVPLGTVEELERRGVRNTGTQNLGGTIVTAGGLVFIAATTDRKFRAFDARTGREIWSAELEAGGHATPMTFRGLRKGKQLIVIAAGGGGFLRDLSPQLSDTLVAFGLSD